jgi:hypothetical protein
MLTKVLFSNLTSQLDDKAYDVKDAFLKTAKQHAQPDFTHTSQFIKRLIYSIINDEKIDQEKNIAEYFNQKELIEVNIFLLRKYMHYDSYDMNNALELLYNCVDTIEKETRIIGLSRDALKIFRQNLVCNSYLESFIRPKYITNSTLRIDGYYNHIAEPFYERIFGSRMTFIKKLEDYKNIDGADKDLVDDILNFLELAYNKKNNVGELDLEKDVLKSNKHRNIRKELK